MVSINTNKDIIQPIRNWIKGEHPGISVIINRPNRQRPKLPYIMVFISAPLGKVGFKDNVQHVNDSTVNIGGLRRFTMSIQSFVSGKDKNFFDSQDMLTKLVDSIQDDTRREPLRKAGLAVWNTGDILDVTEQIETGYEPRAQLDLIMSIASNREADYGVIETVEVTATADGQEDPKCIINS